MGNNGTFCGFYDGASPFLAGAALSPQIPHHSSQNYNRKWAFLEIPPSGRDLGPFLRGFGPKRAKKGQKGGNISVKRGHIMRFPPKQICVIDAEFNVDYDSAIKYDLIQ